MEEKNEKIRLDKWLWAARFYKTRALARTMIEGGKVHYNGTKTKPGRIVEIGSMISLRQGFSNMEVKVLGLSDVRKQAEEARKLYKETPESIEKRRKEMELHKLNALLAPHPDDKPDKKERRTLINFKHEMSSL